MQTKKTRNLLAQTAFALFVAIYAFASMASAGVINHGMVMGPGVAYTDVTESSSDPVPLYGAPLVNGDSLAFFESGSPNPSLGFSAEAAGGSGDLTDGFLNLMIRAKPAAGAISMIEFSEGGDYTMASLGGALAQVSATINVFQLNILEVDGAPISPITLSGIDSKTFNLPGDPAQGHWDLSLSFDLNQVLTNHGVPFTLGATKLSARVNNTLTALSQPGSAAGIFKKDFDITPDTPLDPNANIPEPTTLVLATLGLVGMLAKRRTT